MHHRRVYVVMKVAEMNAIAPLFVLTKIQLDFPAVIVLEPPDLMILRKLRRHRFELGDECGTLTEVCTFPTEAVQRVCLRVLRIVVILHE